MASKQGFDRQARDSLPLLSCVCDSVGDLVWQCYSWGLLGPRRRSGLGPHYASVGPDSKLQKEFLGALTLWATAHFT